VSELSFFWLPDVFSEGWRPLEPVFRQKGPDGMCGGDESQPGEAVEWVVVPEKVVAMVPLVAL
jgi:hypothetical protein